MALTPAEKQRRYRARLRERLELVFAGEGAGLHCEQVEDRDAVMAEPLFPVPKETSMLPRFMGWSRYEWASAPVELARFFGMREAWERWQAEIGELCDPREMPTVLDKDTFPAAEACRAWHRNSKLLARRGR